MAFSEKEKHGVERQFDSYCRKILYRKACNCFTELLNKAKIPCSIYRDLMRIF